MPIDEGLKFGAVVWTPVLLFFEWRRSRRHGFLPGAAIRLAVAGAIVLAAVLHCHIGYCGTGRSLLFGMHPIFVTFDVDERSFGTSLR